MRRRIVKHHSNKVLRSEIGNQIISVLRVPQMSKSGKVIRYKKDTQYKVGKRLVIHHAGEPRLRKLKSVSDLFTWFALPLGKYHDGVMPKKQLCKILYPLRYEKAVQAVQRERHHDITSSNHQ